MYSPKEIQDGVWNFHCHQYRWIVIILSRFCPSGLIEPRIPLRRRWGILLEGVVFVLLMLGFCSLGFFFYSSCLLAAKEEPTISVMTHV